MLESIIKSTSVILREIWGLQKKWWCLLMPPPAKKKKQQQQQNKAIKASKCKPLAKKQRFKVLQRKGLFANVQPLFEGSLSLVKILKAATFNPLLSTRHWLERSVDTFFCQEVQRQRLFCIIFYILIYIIHRSSKKHLKNMFSSFLNFQGHVLTWLSSGKNGSTPPGDMRSLFCQFHGCSLVAREYHVPQLIWIYDIIELTSVTAPPIFFP